jgi:hypothetical protein
LNIPLHLRYLANRYVNERQPLEEYELIDYVENHPELNNPSVLAHIWYRSYSIPLGWATLLTLSVVGTQNEWALFRHIARTINDPTTIAIADYARHRIDPDNAALDDLLDALAQFAQTQIESVRQLTLWG